MPTAAAVINKTRISPDKKPGQSEASKIYATISRQATAGNTGHGHNDGAMAPNPTQSAIAFRQLTEQTFDDTAHTWLNGLAPTTLWSALTYKSHQMPVT